MDMEGFTESWFCWRFMGHRDRSFVMAIVVPGPGVRNARHPSRWPGPVVHTDNWQPGQLSRVWAASASSANSDS
jgi:hypothetical protein